jgi:hypothetical protein
MQYAKAPANVRADWTVYDVPGEPVADVHGTEDRARLIAAAPALLAALEAVAEYWAGGDVPADLDAQILAAIARATSED